jgi:hypothetical protein
MSSISAFRRAHVDIELIHALYEAAELEHNLKGTYSRPEVFRDSVARIFDWTRLICPPRS